MESAHDIRLKRLYFRSSHRGCKESDILIGQFCDRYLRELPEPELAAIEKLLDEDDANIWDWLTGKTAIPEAYLEIIGRLNRFSVQF